MLSQPEAEDAKRLYLEGFITFGEYLRILEELGWPETQSFSHAHTGGQRWNN